MNQRGKFDMVDGEQMEMKLPSSINNGYKALDKKISRFEKLLILLERRIELIEKSLRR